MYAVYFIISVFKYQTVYLLDDSYEAIYHKKNTECHIILIYTYIAYRFSMLFFLH